MVMVVADSILVQRRRAGRLDAPDDALFGEYGEGVVHRLTRDGADFGAHILGKVLRPAVGSLRNRTQHCEPLCCDLEAVIAKDRGEIATHSRRLAIIWMLSI